MLVLFLAMTAFFSSKFLIPSLSTVAYSIVCYKLSYGIRMQNQTMLDAVYKKAFVVHINKYYRIVQCCKRFDNCGNITVMLLIFTYCSILYTGIGLLLRETSKTPVVLLMIEGSFTIFSCIFSVVTLLVFASGIPAAMMETRNTFQQLYRSILLEDISISEKHICLIRALGETEPFYLTAWNFFQIDKGLIFNLFGAALSFCILVMQLKSVELGDLK
ncbi:uncharacterized protein NPIL_35271 [Nephila pilipes]|uniref:Gustatory receptor n=1 Tax=Nephila pilipes TaxID=299642 RepID=A0A8X6ILS3_NEPPI|nr:uncharacterized protein NPIL_35271 [Nephila pilipes]